MSSSCILVVSLTDLAVALFHQTTFGKNVFVRSPPDVEYKALSM